MSDEKRTQNIPCREPMIFVGINLGRHPVSFSVHVVQMRLSLSWEWTYDLGMVNKNCLTFCLWRLLQGYTWTQNWAVSHLALLWLLGNKHFLCAVFTSSQDNENLELPLIIFENEANTEDSKAKRWRKKRSISDNTVLTPGSISSVDSSTSGWKCSD